MADPPSGSVSTVTSRRTGYNGSLTSSGSKQILPKSSNRQIARRSHGMNGNDVVGQVAVFLLKVAALETVRRVSRLTKCSQVWRGIQALQFVCYPPFKWIQRWAPFKGLIKGVRMFSRPLLFLSIATAVSDQSDIGANAFEGGSHTHTETYTESPSDHSSLDERNNDKAIQSPAPKNWLMRLYKELDSQGIALPERINEDELHGFYTATNGNFSVLLSVVKKTIHWRETYRILSQKELEMWSNLVFWHGFDVEHQPCLIVRLGLASINLPPHERPCFTQAVISQVEHGVLHLVGKDRPNITVLIDCAGITPLRIPMQMVTSCTSLLRENYPNHLGYLLVVRLPPVVRVLTQTFFQVLKPATRKKMRILGNRYHRVLSEYLQTLPSYLGGNCSCKTCSDIGINVQQRPCLTNEICKMEPDDCVSDGDDLSASQMVYQSDIHLNDDWDDLVRTAVISILMVWVFIALAARLYDPESRRPF